MRTTEGEPSMLEAGKLVRAAPRHGKVVVVFDVEAPEHLAGEPRPPEQTPGQPSFSLSVGMTRGAPTGSGGVRCWARRR